MKGLLFSAVLGLAVGQLASATTTDALELQVAGQEAIIGDNGACVNVVGTPCSGLSGDVNAAAGTDVVTGTIGGWAISVLSGLTKSPSLVPVGLDLASLTASCSSATCAGPLGALTVHFSDINFATPVPAGGFSTTMTNTQSGAGSVSESAYFSNANTLFTAGTLIGTVGPLTSSGGGSASGGAIAAVPLYSLQIVELFQGGSSTVFSTDANLTAVPEPASLVLLGATLLILATFARKRLLPGKRSENLR